MPVFPASPLPMNALFPGLMLLGLVLLVVGNLLMIGKEDIYSFTKITLAPLVISLGYLVELAAILYRPRS